MTDHQDDDLGPDDEPDKAGRITLRLGGTSTTTTETFNEDGTATVETTTAEDIALDVEVPEAEALELEAVKAHVPYVLPYWPPRA